MFKKLGSYIARWQESIVWLPVLIVMALGIWLVAGVLDELSVVDSLALLVDLPILTGYAIAASALSYLIWRRWSMRLTAEQLEDYWQRLMKGERGAVTVFVVNAGFYLCNSIMLLWFFSPSN